VYRDELQRDTDEPFTGFSPDLKEVYYRLKFKSLSERIQIHMDREQGQNNIIE
jgi:hypothetical protein